MHQTTHHCFQIIACSHNFPPYAIEILMKYSLFFLRVFAHNLRNIKCLLWSGACEIIYNFIFLNYFDTGTISVKEWSLNVIISVFSSKQPSHNLSNCNKLYEFAKSLFLTLSTTSFCCRKLLKNYHLLCKFRKNNSCHPATYIMFQNSNENKFTSIKSLNYLSVMVQLKSLLINYHYLVNTLIIFGWGTHLYMSLFPSVHPSFAHRFYYSCARSCSLGFISRKLCGFLLMFSISFTSLSVLLLFPLLITFFVVMHGFWFYFI